MKKTIEVEEGFDLDTKRFYLPLKVDAKCPNCKSDIQFGEVGTYMFYYPAVGVNEIISTHCNECDETILMNGKINITLEVDPDNLTID